MTKLEPCPCNGKTKPVPKVERNEAGKKVYVFYCPSCRRRSEALYSPLKAIWIWNDMIRSERLALQKINKR